MQAGDTQQTFLPDQIQDKHSLFELNRNSVANWIGSLPGANFGETTKLLYSAVVELNKVKCSPKTRLRVLDQLRHHVHTAIRGLERHYLNKPIVLAENALKIVQLSDNINDQMATAYGIAIRDLLTTNRLLRSRSLLALAIHRALTEHSLILLRDFQLYRSEQAGFWLTVHELYQKAQQNRVSQLKVSDDLWGNSTIEQCYLRPILLHAAHPYQLRQQRQAEVFTNLSSWVADIHIQAATSENCIFVFNPLRDQAPEYRSDEPVDSGWLGIDTEPLCQLLEDRLQSMGNHEDKYDVLKYLRYAWSTRAERDTERTSGNEALQLSLGLYPTHYFVAEGRAFTDFVNSCATDYSAEPGDAEEILIQSIDYQESSLSTAAANYRNYHAQVVNSSEGGYCINWPAHERARLHTGDIVGIDTDCGGGWQVGLIRWVKRVDRDSHHVGVEILANAANACSARQSKLSTSSGEHHRALLLAPREGSGVVNRLLLQKSVFHTGDTLELKQFEQTLHVKLEQRLEQTPSVSVYTFSTVDIPEQNISEIPDHNKNKEQAPSADGDGADKQGFDKFWEAL